MDDSQPISSAARNNLPLGEIETDETKLRRILDEVARLFAEAQELIERGPRTRH